MAVEQDRLDRLSPRQRTCLGMVAAHISPKQIARDLGISEHTVRGYLAEAILILGAQDLRHASRLYVESAPTPPEIFGGERLRLAGEGVAGAPPAAEEVAAAFAAGDLVGAPAPSFHFLRGDRQHNTLDARQRIIWIVAASFIALFLLATSAFVLDMLAKLAHSLTAQ